MFGHRPLHRTYEVQALTGRAVSVEPTPRTHYYRGQLYRAAMPAIIMPAYHVATDPSNPSTWVHRGR